MDELAKAAGKHRRAVERADESRDLLRREILNALASGVSQAEIARVTGYTRERLRQIARESE